MFFSLSAVGAVFRRWWGGWHVHSHILKVLVGYSLSLSVGMFVIHGFYAALAFGLVVGSAWLNPLHSWGMGMGYDKSGKSTLACISVMGGSYGLFSALAAGLTCWLSKDMGYAWYALTGFLVPFPYFLAWIWAVRRGYLTDPTKMQFLKIGGQWFIDSPTAIGECFLGALLLSMWHV